MRTIKLLFIFLLLAAPAYATQQVIIGRTNVNLNTGSTTYTGPMCGGGTTAYCDHFTTLSQGEGIWPTGGTISDFCVELSGSPDNGAGTQSYAFTFYVNGASTTQTVTISETSTSGCTAGAAASVSTAQGVTIETIPSGTPTARALKYSYVFNSTTSGESVYVVNEGSTGMNTAGNNRRTPIPSGVANWGTNDDRRFSSPTTGTIKSLYCRTSGDPDNGAGTQSYTFNLRENGANSALTCAVSDGATTCNDPTNTIAVIAGDTYALNHVSANTPVSRTGGCGFVFLADTPGEWIIPSNIVAVSSTSTVYGTMQSGTNSATETARDGLASIGFTVTDIYVTLSAATDVDGTLQFNLREETTTTMGTTCTVGTASTTCSGTTDSTITALNTYDMQSIPSTTPGAPGAWIGLTGYIAESGGGGRSRRLL